jgi:diguanylate cyclase (GGDEF)-like protein/PAS domain S-box-containing protein
MRWTVGDLKLIYTWLNLTYCGIVVAPAGMLVFAFTFTQQSFTFTRRHYLLLSIEPVITLLLIWTDPLHGLFFGGFRSMNSILVGGIWFYFNAVYTYTLMTISLVILARYVRDSINMARQQALIILIGFLIPIVACALELLGLFSDKGPDLTPFFFLISGFVVIFGFFYYRLLDISPIAHSRLFQTSEDALIVLDEERRIVDVNLGGRRLLDLIQGGIGMFAVDAFSPWPLISRMLNSEEHQSAAVHMDFPKASFDFDVTISPIHTTSLNTGGWLMMFHDISTFKQTEAALVASENKIRSLFLSITDSVLVIDKNGKYLEIAPTNPSGSSRDPLQIIGKSVKDVFPENETRQILEAIRTALESHQLVQHDYKMMINGKDLWFSGNVSPLTDDSVIWIARDITERKKMEQDLRERELRLGLAQEIAHVGYWEYELKSNQFWASEEYYKIMGVDPASGISSLDELEKFFRYKDKTKWSDSTRNWIEALPDHEGDIEIIREGETEPRVLHTITRVEYNPENTPEKMVGVVHDITAQKRVEKALEKRMMALTRPLEKADDLKIEDLFNLDDLQNIQDDFSNALGVASIITRLDGTPITQYSNFTRLCGQMIRIDEVGCRECIAINADLSQRSSDGKPFMVPCPNTQLMHASAPIMVGGNHIANWLIGQIRLEGTSPQATMDYVRRLGLNEEEAVSAFEEIPVITEEKFTEVTRALFTLSSYLSNTAYQNVQQARFITDRRKAEDALRLSETKLRSLFKAMTDVIIIYGEDGEYREIAATNSQRYYRPPDELLHNKITEIFPEDIATLFLRTIRQTLELKEMTRLDYSLVIGGREYWFSANVSPYTEDSVIWVARDITDRKKVEDTLHYQSTHDTLTGLYNRQYYETEIQRLQYSRLFPISIIMIDVDGLKWVNDHRGHHAGDELLQRVAGLLKSAFRPEDMVARMGGDEFVVVLPQTGEPAARQAVKRLDDILEKHNQLFPADQHLGISVGTATGSSGMLLTEVFKMADQAMYLVKSRKKGQAVRSEPVIQEQIPPHD